MGIKFPNAAKYMGVAVWCSVSSAQRYTQRNKRRYGMNSLIGLLLSLLFLFIAVITRTAERDVVASSLAT